MAKISSSSFWHAVGAWLQLLTAMIHGTSLFAESTPANETEKQMLALVRDYKMDMGAGFFRSFDDLFLSISAFMTLSLFFAAAINFAAIRSTDQNMRRNIILANLVYSATAANVFYLWAFLPPFVCLSLIAAAFAASFLRSGK